MTSRYQWPNTRAAPMSSSHPLAAGTRLLLRASAMPAALASVPRLALSCRRPLQSGPCSGRSGKRKWKPELLQVARGTELGRRAQEYVERRDFVPDGLVLELIRERIAEVPRLAARTLG